MRNNRSVNMVQRRNAVKSNGRSRHIRAGVGAAPPTTVVTRSLHRMATVNLSTANPNGGTEIFFSFGTTLDSYDAYEQLCAQYEQYRIKNIKMWVRPNAQNLAGLTDAIDRIGASYALTNYSTCESFIDYDTQIAPSQNEIYRRDKVQITKLDGAGWHQIASFTPKVRFDSTTISLPALVTSNDWLSTAYPELRHLGVRGVFKQDSDFWGTTASTAARMSVYYTATVEFRGLKNAAT